MQANKYFKLAVLCAALGASAFANAALIHNQNVTNNVIFGTGGQANGGFTINTVATTGISQGIQVGLRARERTPPTNIFNSNGDGTFSHVVRPTGLTGPAANLASWNFDWSINTGGATLGSYTYRLGIDFDAGFGTNFLFFDLINAVNPTFGLVRWDHSFGNNSTAQSAGVEASNAADYAALRASSNLVQNSWNMDFFDSALFPFNPTTNGNYSISLEVIGANNFVLASSQIMVIVGTGANAVPEPGTLALAGLALAGLGFARRRRA